VLFFNAFQLGTKIENQTKKQNKRNYFCCFQIISESKEAIRKQNKEPNKTKEDKTKTYKSNYNTS
jgi:hypothetical protein